MEKEKKEQNIEVVKQLVDVDAHLGRKKSSGHPKMKPYIFTTRQNTQIINLEKTAEKIEDISDVLKETISNGGIVLFVSVIMPSKHLVREMAEELNMPYVCDRWIGGTLTNFKIISKRINYLLKQEEKKSKGELSKYTKKEQLDMDKEMADLEKKIGGIKSLKKHPDMIFLVDAPEHEIAIKEAKKVGVPIVALSNTNTDPSMVDHLIPANDKSVKSIKFILDKLKESIVKGVESSKVKTEEKKESK